MPEPIAALLGASLLFFLPGNHGKRAIDYRRQNKISDDLGTAVNVVAMVFGNRGMDSGTGVAFTNQMGDAFGEDGSLPSTCAGDDQNRSMDVFDRLTLIFVQFDRAETWIGFCDCH